MKKFILYVFFNVCTCFIYGQNVPYVNRTSLLRYANFAKQEGKYKEAIEKYSIIINSSPSTPMLLESLSNRAFCYKNMAEYNKSFNDYKQILACNNLPAPYQSRVLLNLSNLLLEMGQIHEAEIVLRKLKFNSSSTEECIRIGNLSYALEVQGLHNEAELFLSDILDKEISPELKGIALQNSAYIHMHKEFPDYTRAIIELETAIDVLTDENQRYISMGNLAVAEAFNCQFEKALMHIDSVIKWQANNPNIGVSHPDFIISLRKKAEILLLQGNGNKALKQYEDYYKKEIDFVLANFSFMTEQQRLNFWKKEKPLLSEIFALEKDSTDFLYNVALFRRQIALLGNNDSMNVVQKLSISKDNVSKNLGKKDVAIEFVKYEKENKNRYAALLLSGSDKKNVRFIPLWLEDSIKTYNIDGNRLDSALCSKVRADKDKVYQNEALSAFIWDKLLPFIPEGSTVYFAPDGILHLLAVEYLPSVNNGKYELHRLTTTALLVEKKKKTKKPNAKALVVGGMDYDFIAPKDDSGSTSANQDAFKYLLQNKKLMYFTYLPGSRVEADSIINYLSGIDRYEDIDESSLKNKMGNYGKVHLATHGYSWHVDVPSVPYAFRDSITEDKSLLASGIALSGVNELYRFPFRDDGLLSARELCEMNLTGVDLVVASSCQSAQGRVSDEGPTGLVRGLKKAGVRTIIASLWPVSDKATMLLMQFFYDEWREGKGKHGKGCSKTRALHLAQERLKEVDGNSVKIRTYNSSRKTGDYKTVTTKYDSPYYWAPFIIIDDI